MVCVSFYVICIVELLVSSVICRFQGLSYLHVPDCIRVFFYFVNSSHHSSYFHFCTKCNILDINLLYNMNFIDHLLFYMQLLNYLFCIMFERVLECVEKIWALLRSLHWLYSNYKFQGLFWSIRYKRYRLSMIYSGLFFIFVLFA